MKLSHNCIALWTFTFVFSVASTASSQVTIDMFGPPSPSMLDIPDGGFVGGQTFSYPFTMTNNHLTNRCIILRIQICEQDTFDDDCINLETSFLLPPGTFTGTSSFTLTASQLNDFGGSVSELGTLEFALGTPSFTSTPKLAAMAPIPDKLLSYTPPPGESLLGSLTPSGQVDWYVVGIADAAVAANFYQVDTNGSAVADLEIGVYDFDGNLIASDDNDGDGLQALLRFGSGGSDGTLAQGYYYVAVGGQDTQFGAMQFSVTSSSPLSGNYLLNLTTNIPVPEPTGLAALTTAAVILGLVCGRTRGEDRRR